MQVTNPMQTFTFEDKAIRIVTDDAGDPLFHANDVCRALHYTNAREALRKHVEGDGVTKRDIIDRMGRKQSANFVTEPGLYSLIMGSHKPEARRFKRWVVGDVLPTLRRTGEYRMADMMDVPPSPAAPPLEDDVSIRLTMIAQCRRLFGRDRARWLWSHLGLPIPTDDGPMMLERPMDPITRNAMQYLSDQAQIPDHGTVAAHTLFQGYMAWCAKTGQEAASRKGFGGVASLILQRHKINGLIYYSRPPEQAMTCQ